jgi:serine O-acetyltransferase
MFDNLRRDASRYEEHWYASAGFWITAIYRYGMWASALPSPARLPMWIVYRIVRLLFFRRYNVHLWAGRHGCRIGPGLYLIHPTNVMIGKNVEIGPDCLIFHDVTLGTGLVPGTPKIGANVDIYVGARILGGVKVGDRVMIGANCVVTRDVGSDMVVMPAAVRGLPRALSPHARGKAAEVGQAATDEPAGEPPAGGVPETSL